MTTKMCTAGICSQLHARMIRWKIHILLFMVLHSSVFASIPRKEELHYTTLQLIRKNGYPAEAHSVTTEDGYILEMHRIPYSFKAPVMNSKAAVFLMHGLSASSIDWVIMGPKRSIGYLLADAGYDVWLGNNRGNTYSKKHKSISPKSKKFWDFSWHEIGIYDLPAQIDYILRNTQQQSVYYVGMSMGNTVFFVLAAEKPEYNQKIKLSIALAPVVFMKYITSPLLRNVEFVLNLLPLLGEDFVHGKNFISTIGKNACGSRIGRFLCSKFQVMASGSGDDANQLNHEMIPMIASNYPAGCPIKSILHYKQLVHSGKFQKYDYEECNMAKYNQMTPPEYNLTAITCPVAILYADNDGFSDPKDVLRLHRILRNVVNLYRIPWPNFGHFGFIYAKDIKALVNDEILQVLGQY